MRNEFREADEFQVGRWYWVQRGDVLLKENLIGVREDRVVLRNEYGVVRIEDSEVVAGAALNPIVDQMKCGLGMLLMVIGFFVAVAGACQFHLFMLGLQ